MASLSYLDKGNGFPILLIHGFCESKEVWDEFAEQLQTQFRIIAPDLPGFGDSPLTEKRGSIEYYADKIKDLLQELGVTQCAMVGHSLGGYVTLAFAEKYPDFLKGFGLFHSTAFADTEEKKANRTKAIEFIETNGVPTFIRQFFAPLFASSRRDLFRTTIEWLTQLGIRSSLDGVINATRAMRDRADRIDLLQKTELPVLFIIGKEDSAVPFEKSLEQSKLPQNSFVCILEETGHMGMFEKKEESLKALTEFVFRLQ